MDILTNIENSIDKQLDTYNKKDRDKMDVFIRDLILECQKISEKYLEDKKVPMYISPISSDSEKYVEWAELNPSQHPYGEKDDNICRYLNGIKSYPIKINENQATIESCDKFYNDDVNIERDLEEFIKLELIRIKLNLINIEISDSYSITKVRKNTKNKIREYENLQYQYLQLLQLIEINQDLITRREKKLNDDDVKIDDLSNEYNIEKDHIQDFIKTKQDVEKIEVNRLFYLKIFSYVFFVITIGLLLLKKTIK